MHRRSVGVGVISRFDSSSLWPWLSRGRSIIRCSPKLTGRLYRYVVICLMENIVTATPRLTFAVHAFCVPKLKLAASIMIPGLTKLGRR